MVPGPRLPRGAPAFTAGAPGGRTIISALPQVVCNLVDLKATAQAAIEAPRLHTEGGEVR
jgi:gamma-glutamyltranspeptidase